MSPVATPEAISAKYAAQREHLQGLLDEGLEGLRDMAERRKALVYDVTTGSADRAELEALERQMAAKTTDTDRLRLSIDEIAGREAAEQKVAEMNRTVALRKDLERQLGAVQKAGVAVAGAVEALAKTVVAAQLAEDLAASIAGQLDLQLDPLSVAFLLPRSLLAEGLVLAPIDHLEKQQILSARARGDAEFRPTERLRAKRGTQAAMRMREAI